MQTVKIEVTVEADPDAPYPFVVALTVNDRPLTSAHTYDVWGAIASVKRALHDARGYISCMPAEAFAESPDPLNDGEAG